jgi:hypothetical protein
VDFRDQIERRRFLQLGGLGFGALASRTLRDSWPSEASTAGRKLPDQPVVLRSAKLKVTLDGKDGLPYAYELLSGERIRGEDFGRRVSATICDRSAWAFPTLDVLPTSHAIRPTRADFLFEVKQESKTAVRFTIRYELNDSTLHTTLEDVQESRGFEMIEVALPCLATVREKDGQAWLAHGDDGGSLVMLCEAKAGELAPNTFWGAVMASLPVVMIGTDRVACVQETTAFMDYTLLAITGEAGNRHALLGTVQRHRVNGSLCCDMNTGPGTPRNCGNRRTPNLLVGQKPACRLDFVLPAVGKSTVDWLDATRLVRSRMPKAPTDYYDGKFIYGIRCDEPKFEKPSAKFEQCEGIIREVASLTDHAPQIAHLWGWQYRGKDTGYPAVAEVNPRLGGFASLKHLLAEGPKHNCRVTFSDNYDDAYRSSPAWDPAIIARRPDGELWESRNWTGENSYIIGLAKYMAGPGPERIRYTCQHYGLQETIHVDVLSYFTVRNDWDREHPASGIKNLYDGRYRVIEEFKKYGVDVTSEAMRYAAIGRISFFWHIASAKPCPFGGIPIPLQPMIYRKSASWGEGGGRGELIDRVMNTLFYNGCMHLILRNDIDRKEISDLYFLNLLPWFKVKNRSVESFQREGMRTTIGLEGSSRIEQDWETKTYSVVVDGVEIAKNLATFCPLDARRIAFYSYVEQELTSPLPRLWNPQEISGVSLHPQGTEPFPIRVDNGSIHVKAPARSPVIVYRKARS